VIKSGKFEIKNFMDEKIGQRMIKSGKFEIKNFMDEKIGQRIFHGSVTPNDFAKPLISEFNVGNLKAQQIGSGKQVLVQISTRERPRSGGQTALTVSLLQVDDGVAVQLGKQSWMGIAASLGQSALSTWRNPWRIIERLDDIAQDIEYFQLADQIWKTIEDTASAFDASFALSLRLRRVVCDYCFTANPIGEPNCIACGAPLGKQQPITCKNCGFIVKRNEFRCPNCKTTLSIKK
jgi:hypothetical protein